MPSKYLLKLVYSVRHPFIIEALINPFKYHLNSCRNYSSLILHIFLVSTFFLTIIHICVHRCILSSYNA